MRELWDKKGKEKKRTRKNFKGPRYKAFKSDTPTKILPYEFIHGQVSPATLT